MAKAKFAVSSVVSDDLLKKAKVLLENEKERLEKDLEAFGKKDQNVGEEHEGTFPDYGDKDDENASEVADYAANLSIEEDLEKTLRDVNSSLDRIKKGTYGICKYCKKPIEEKRISARPTSSACVACKKAIIQEV